MKRKKILIVGGTGFIGFHLAKKCLDLNWSVVSVSTNYVKYWARPQHSIKSLIPSSGTRNGGTVVQVHGYNFPNSKKLSCAFINEASSVSNILVSARWLTESLLECITQCALKCGRKSVALRFWTIAHCKR